MQEAMTLDFCLDVVAVARQSDGSISQVARDSGILESRLQRWLTLDDVEEECRPKMAQTESAELREAKKWKPLMEREKEGLRRAAQYVGREPP